MADEFNLTQGPDQDTVASDDDAFLEELRKVRQSSGLETPPSTAPGEPPPGSSPLGQELEQSGFFEQQKAAQEARARA